MSLLDWVNLVQHVPVYSGGARWGSYGSLVDPSLLGVESSNQLTVSHIADRWVISAESKRIKEVINSCDLISSHVFIVIIYVENNTQGSGHVFSLRRTRLWEMDSVHFQIILLSVDCMLGA